MTSRQRADLLETIRPRLRALAEQHPRLTTAADDLDWCAPHALAALQRMQDARPGLPGAQAYDAPTVSGGKAGLTHPERLADQPDRTAHDRATAETDLGSLDVLTRSTGAVFDRDEWCTLILRHALHFRRLVEAWTPRAPSDKQRTAVARANDPEAECAHHRSFGTFEPVHRTTDGGGLLNVKTPLCRFCYDRLRSDGRLPSADRMQRLADGRADRVRA